MDGIYLGHSLSLYQVDALACTNLRYKLVLMAGDNLSTCASVVVLDGDATQKTADNTILPATASIANKISSGFVAVTVRLPRIKLINKCVVII